MNTEKGDGSDDIEDDDNIVVADDGDDVSDLSSDINIEELMAKLESTPKDALDRQRQIRRRIDELREALLDPVVAKYKVLKDLDNTYNFNLDEDL